MLPLIEPAILIAGLMLLFAIGFAAGWTLARRSAATKPYLRPGSTFTPAIKAEPPRM